MAAANSINPVSLTCNKCKLVKPIDQFRRRPNRSENGPRKGRWSYCTGCERARAKTPRARALANQRTKEFRQRLKATDYAEYRRRERENNLRQKYGFGEDEYQTLVENHGGVCAICGEPPTKGRGKKLVIDHDHETGAFRGLLCAPCNASLGGFKDDPAVLAKAIEYLRRHGRG